jgi:hypothetical protein
LVTLLVDALPLMLFYVRVYCSALKAASTIVSNCSRAALRAALSASLQAALSAALQAALAALSAALRAALRAALQAASAALRAALSAALQAALSAALQAALSAALRAASAVLQAALRAALRAASAVLQAALRMDSSPVSKYCFVIAGQSHRWITLNACLRAKALSNVVASIVATILRRRATTLSVWVSAMPSNSTWCNS